jgi:hypothetical protein
MNPFDITVKLIGLHLADVRRVELDERSYHVIPLPHIRLKPRVSLQRTKRSW